ncbi:hypothetical protein BH09MYX1_BH09MYX1_05860 [soil metagenome]
MRTNANRWPIALALVGVSGALAVAPACRAPTEIMVTLTTNVDCSGAIQPSFVVATSR